MSADIGQEDIIIGDYVGMVCYSDKSCFHLRNADGGCGIGMENVIRMTALSRRIDEVEGVSWCGVGSVIITEQHCVLWQNECHLLPGQHLAKSHQQWDMHTFQQHNA